MDNSSSKLQLKISDEMAEMIVNFGSLEYDNERIAAILEIEIEDIEIEMNNELSEFYQFYKKGRYRAEYAIDVRLFEMARTGDTRALEKLEQRKRKRERK